MYDSSISLFNLVSQTASANDTFVDAVRRAVSAVVAVASDVVLAASMMTPLAPSTPITEPTAASYRDEAGVPAQLFFRPSLFTQRVDYPVSAGPLVDAGEAGLWASELWQSDFLANFEGQCGPVMSGSQIVFSPAWVLSPAETIPADEFNAACQEAVSLAQGLSAGQFGTPSADLIALAKRAVQRQQTQREEQVEVWAERLAREVENATD